MPTISVGNIAMGGRGKTPVVAYIARLLIAAGERPAILSRGYRRRRPEDGAVIVSDGTHILADLDRSGDEPLMLARLVPGAAVVVCDVRTVAAALATRVLGTTVNLLDDGFQHRAMRRDVDIVIVAPEDLGGRPLPFGRLRSPVSALQRADAVVMDGPASAFNGIAWPEETPNPRPVRFQLCRSVNAPAPLEPERPWPSGRWPVVAVAGIAQPERFTEALRRAGWHVARSIAFSDHHRYTPRDLERIAAAVRETGAGAVLTTSKDAVRLLPLRPLPVPVAAVPLEVSLDPPDAFRDWLTARLREVRA